MQPPQQPAYQPPSLRLARSPIPASRAARRGALRATVLGTALLCTGLCAPALAARHAQPELSAHGAWIRWLPAGLPAAGYLRLDNRSAEPITLVNADSPTFYSSVKLHRTVTTGGIRHMQSVERIVVPAHSSLRLGPGGYHIMLLNAKRTIEPGMHVPITLRFAHGKDLTVDFVVRRSHEPAVPATPVPRASNAASNAASAPD